MGPWSYTPGTLVAAWRRRPATEAIDGESPEIYARPI